MKRRKQSPFTDAETYRGLGTAVREQILRSYTPDSCIATCAATVDVLKQSHVDAYPLTVTATVVNKTLYDAANELGRYPELGSEEYPHGGYGILIGHDTGEEIPGRWPGHLVVIAERKWLLDFSIDQANRPIYGIELHPLVLPVTEAFLVGREHVVYRYNDVYLYYHARPKDKSFKTRLQWSGELRPVVHLKDPS